MSVIAEFTLRTPITREALERDPNMEFQVQQFTGLEDDEPALFVWAWGGDFEGMEDALSGDPSVTEVNCIAGFDQVRLYQISLSPEGVESTTFRIWGSVGAVLLSSRRDHDRWRLKMQFPDRDAFAAYVEFCEANDLELTVTRLFRPENPNDVAGVTVEQREALLAAYEEGYFAVPRRVSQRELAGRLGISGQALSERIRRGTDTLVESVLVKGTRLTASEAPRPHGDGSTE